MTTPAAPDWSTLDAVLFDLDGVLTRTAQVHAASWKTAFDRFLDTQSSSPEASRPFDDDDYHRFVDGKPRLDGVRDFLASRGITLPEGTEDDPAGAATVHGLGRAKNDLVQDALRTDGVETYQDALDFLGRTRTMGLRPALVTSSRNASAILEAAGLQDAFEARVDGNLAAELGLKGKPAPDTYLEGARRLGVDPTRAVVVEDAISGVEAGRAGAFGLVVGAARAVSADELLQHGADVAVSDLRTLLDPCGGQHGGGR